ncbi:MAG: bifunctional diaminohydroxyphosphoribosylaminopyrimidine deaminase/5-amino-6-(5-phosphoribosylamino)uracil reductase RibD [Rhizobacter sp.]
MDPVLASPCPMAEALRLAAEAIGLCEPNPRVGCVIVADDGRVIGRGHTQEAGGPHAEVMALRDAAHAGADVRGATLYVTLEPCSHYGRTPPCTSALIRAGLSRVVMAVEDPNPLVRGAGAAQLRAAGITVELGDAAASHAARELNIGFFSRMQRGRPWTRLKAAVSLDGRSALENGASRWITGATARADGHAYRKRASAVLTGVGTVRDDDPRLDVRLVPTARQPLRVVVDSRLEIPINARVLEPPGEVLVYAAAAEARHRLALEQRGIEVVLLPSAHGKVDLPAVLAHLAGQGVNELHVEAGEKLSGSFVREELVDEYLVYVAPKLLGRGRDLARFGPLASLDDAIGLRFESVDAIGADLRIVARPANAAGTGPEPIDRLSRERNSGPG